ncbi:type II toxin-antitoxin system VapC family toxin [Micromonospora sp. AMSO31t]|uniref:type II toxin-antitoxin system VapC family toxin n=1 Tax=Micromonospora sp. AMSO31t TaxID=2650566 RepID=UPI00124BBA8F|nr:type II toxin-antitoxin system VapC family toxin [Micromonospora sp. AMSO31t]KAB1914699.1 type II toxin-antitoxin system VapC family toxin [Micromonospora sp. AMSO31t]
MIYLDSAAVIKMLRREDETPDLIAWLNDHAGAPLVSSALVEVEVPRALRRAAPQALVGVPSVLGRLYRVEIDAAVRAAAGAYVEPLLRSLDAIHLATAQALARQAGADFVAFVTYDRRLLDAAKSVGLAVASPGMN